MKNSLSKIVVVTSSGLQKQMLDAIDVDHNTATVIAVPDDKGEIMAAIPEADALINCPRHLFDSALLSQARQLKWIHCGGAGVEEFLIPELIDSDIEFTNGRIIQGPEVSDHAIALLLCLTRRLNLTLTNREIPNSKRPIELRGKTAAVFGLGGIGLLVAEKLKAFGVTVTGVDVEYQPMTFAVDEFVTLSEFRREPRRFEIIVCAAPTTKLTYKFFDREFFAKINPVTYFINVSRGDLVDLDALTEANQDNRFGGIGLDVTDPEPLPSDHSLRKMTNVIISPHIAGLSDHNRARGLTLLKQNIKRFLDGQQLINPVDKVRGY